MANKKVEIKEGQVYNRLTVVNYAGKGKQGHLLYNCLCECGRYKIVTGSSLIRDENQSCGCLKSENTHRLGKSRIGKSNLTKGEAGLNHLYSQYKHGAKKRNLEFTLSKECIKEISSKNCYYCGVSPKQKMNRESSHGEYLYNGIDRLDNKKGYNIENCVPCCKQCNLAKNVMSYTEFINWVKVVFETSFYN
jgi:5-methylcytosine-specific restriction endonuclease McrA